MLHRISGLSNFFLYFNNDVLLANPTPLPAFMRAGRYFKFEDWSLEPSDAVPECRFAADAPWSTIMPHVRHCASKVAFFWDRVVAHKAWSVRLEYWYPHSVSLSCSCFLPLALNSSSALWHFIGSCPVQHWSSCLKLLHSRVSFI